MNQVDLQNVDWSRIPAPLDDGGAVHLTGKPIAACPLPSTTGRLVDLSALNGRIVV